MSDPVQQTKEGQEPTKTKEEEILELAKQELMREIKCASMRAEQFGAHSWAKPQNYVPSKRFLRQMLMSTSRSNERADNKEKNRRYMKQRENHDRKRASPEKHISKKSYHLKIDMPERKKSRFSRELSPSKQKSKYKESKYSDKKHHRH